MEKVEKAVLVKNNIRRDIAEIYRESMYPEEATAPYLVALVICVVILCCLLPAITAPKFAVLFGVILALLTVGVILWNLIPYIKKKKELKRINEMPIRIVKGTLQSVREDARFRRVGKLHLWEDEYTFSKGRTFVAKSVAYYAWSDTYYMSREGVRNTAVNGNEFYLVFEEGKSKVLMIYNTKFFKYPEIDEFDL